LSLMVLSRVVRLQEGSPRAASSKTAVALRVVYQAL
jgi:hypothetical protein